MASSTSSCAWPSAVLWKSAFKQHYSSSSLSKWHQLYTDIGCVLLGLKTALLVDCVSPDAKKLQLYLKDVAKSMHDTDNSGSGSTIKCDSSAVCQFCHSMSDCCILTIGEDTLLVNVRHLTRDWGIAYYHHADHDDSKLKGHTLEPVHSVDSRAPPLRDGPVYLDITKGRHQPKLLDDENQVTLNGIFIQWLGVVKSSYQQNTVDKTELCIIPCCTKIPNSSTQTLSSVQQQTGDKETLGDTELNVCTLFGQLLGYPVVYWFDTERGYSLDMVELSCFTVSVCKSDSEASPLNIEQVAT